MGRQDGHIVSTWCAGASRLGCMCWLAWGKLTGRFWNRQADLGAARHTRCCEVLDKVRMVAAWGAVADKIVRVACEAEARHGARVAVAMEACGLSWAGLGSPGAAASKQAASRQGRKLCGRGWLACAAGVLEVAADLWLRQGGPATVRIGK